MAKIQILRIISILGALLVGFWLPIRVIDFHLPIWIDVTFDLLVSVISIVNISIYFMESENDFKNWRHWGSSSIILDLICLMPFSLFEYILFQTENVNFLLINLIATRHIWKIKSFLEEFHNLQPVVYRLVPIGIMMPLLVHLISCAWIALGSGTAGPDPDKYMEYVRAVYWSFTTLTTVGYGDISAKTPPQMMFAAFTQIIGVGVFGFVLSNVASLLSRLDAAREHHMTNLDQMESFMSSHQLPLQLKAKIRGYYHHLWKNHRGYSDRGILDALPNKIQSEVFFYLNQNIIEKVAMLKGASQEMLEDLMHELEPRIFVPGERIFRAGDDGDSMYFIHSGQVDILTKDGTKIVTLSDGSFFGEMALITNQTRNATAKAASYCDLYVLSKTAFSKVLNDYPEFKTQVQKVADERSKAA